VSRLLGIDPGIGGALALLSDGEVIEIADMPVVTSRGKRRVDPAQLAALIASWRPIDHAGIELATARPGQGSVSMLGYGRSYGIVVGVLSALGIPYSEITAPGWKRKLSVPSDKGAARLRAGQLLPAAARHWPFVKHHGRAEAALLALFDERMNGGD